MTAYLINLGAFWLLLFGVVLVPGMDMAIIVGSTLTGGRRAGTLALAGVVTASMAHVLIATLGISVVLIRWPVLFHVLLAGGATYLGWIGIQIVACAGQDTAPAKAGSTQHAIFRRAALTNLSNPKAYLFALAVIPQFLRPALGKLPLQVAALALLIAITQIGVYGTFAILAERAHRSALGRPAGAKSVQKAMGAALVVVALFLLGELIQALRHGTTMLGRP